MMIIMSIFIGYNWHRLGPPYYNILKGLLMVAVIATPEKNTKNTEFLRMQVSVQTECRMKVEFLTLLALHPLNWNFVQKCQRKKYKFISKEFLINWH